MDMIHVYSKDQAVEDGFQYKVDEQTAKEAGFLIPVYITSGVHDLCLPPAGLEGIQDHAGRLWDVLALARLCVRAMIRRDDHLGSFKVYFTTGRNEGKDFDLYIVFDALEGFTIMLPEEY